MTFLQYEIVDIGLAEPIVHLWYPFQEDHIIPLNRENLLKRIKNLEDAGFDASVDHLALAALDNAIAKRCTAGS